MCGGGDPGEPRRAFTIVFCFLLGFADFLLDSPLRGALARGECRAQRAEPRFDEQDEVASFRIEREERLAADRPELVLAVQLEVDAKDARAPRAEHALVAAGQVRAQ